MKLISLLGAIALASAALAASGTELVYTYDAQAEHVGIPGLLLALSQAGIDFKDVHTTQSSLEDIFVSLVGDAPEATATSEAAEATP